MESCDSDRSSGAMILYADCVALRLHADGHARSSRLAISIKSSASIIVGFVLGVLRLTGHRNAYGVTDDRDILLLAPAPIIKIDAWTLLALLYGIIKRLSGVRFWKKKPLVAASTIQATEEGYFYSTVISFSTYEYSHRKRGVKRSGRALTMRWIKGILGMKKHSPITNKTPALERNLVMTTPKYLPPEQRLPESTITDALECQKGIEQMKQWIGFPALTNIEFMIWFRHWLDAGRALVPYPESLRHVDATLAEVQRVRSAPQTNEADKDSNERTDASISSDFNQLMMTLTRKT